MSEDLNITEEHIQVGSNLSIHVNVNAPDELDNPLLKETEGIGLFRSEYLFLESKELPSEDYQYEVYKKALEIMEGKRVIIRTVDIGADKQVDYLNLDTENNPALGLRGIRVCLERPDIFRTQLRALYRASVYGNLAIMYPMIVSVDEVLKIREISKSVREELEAEGVALGEVEEGIMIETPAAAIMSDELARHVDFFSIGTNDLTQYTLAVDRRSAKMDSYYDAHHPALLRMIRMVIDNGHKEGIWVGICGELGADSSLAATFIEMGIDELSVDE